MKKIIYYFIFINLFTFLIFGIDKYRAIKNKYRIKEKTLFGLSLIGGSFGAFIGMKLFHHKTIKPSFKYTIPVIALLELFLIIYISRK